MCLLLPRAPPSPLTHPHTRAIRTLFFFPVTPTTEIYTLSLHDALPICSNSSTRGPWVMNGSVRAALTDPFITDRKSTRLNSSHVSISYAVFCLKKKKTANTEAQCVVHGWNVVLRERAGAVAGELGIVRA